MIDNRTTNKNYPLPHPDNIASQDVARIATAISMIDSDVTSCLTSVETMNSVVSGLETKALKIPNELVGQVDTELGDIIPGRYIVVNEDATGFSTVEGGGGEGGKKGEILVKKSDANFDTGWLDPRTILKKAPVIKETETDVQLPNNCTMILEDEVENESDDVPHQGLTQNQISSDVIADSSCSYVLCDTIDDTAEDNSDIATGEKFGRVKIGSGININDGVISVPVIGLASEQAFGMVRVGSGLNIEEGVVSTQPYPHADSETFGLVKPGSDFYFDSGGALNVVKRSRDIIYQTMSVDAVENGVVEIVPTCACYRAYVYSDILFSFNYGDFVPDSDISFDLEIVSDGTHLVAFDANLGVSRSVLPVNRGTTRIKFSKKLGIPLYDMSVSRLDAPEPINLTPTIGTSITSEFSVTMPQGGSWLPKDFLKTTYWSYCDLPEVNFKFETLVCVDYVYYVSESNSSPMGEFILRGSNDGVNWTTLLYRNGVVVYGKVYTDVKGCFRYYNLKIGYTASNNKPSGVTLWGTQIDNNESELIPITPYMASNQETFATLTGNNITGGSASDLTDYNFESIIILAKESDNWIKYELSEARVANILELNYRDSNYYSFRSGCQPNWFKLEGSNDDTTWSLLLERQYQGSELQKQNNVLFYEFDNQTAYRYYKFTCIATNSSDAQWNLAGLKLYQRKLGKHNFYNVIPLLTSATQDGYEVTASSQYDGGHAPVYAFDGNNDTKWASSGTGTQWLQIKLPTATICNAVKIVSRTDGYTNQCPRDFEIRGSNDAETWTTLTTQTGVAWASSGQSQSFNFENETAYQYYRLVITANNGEGAYSLSGVVLGRSVWEYKRKLDTYRKLVPVMTANSQNGFVVTASATYSGSRVYYPYLAFNDTISDSDSWTTRGQSGWLQIELPEADKANVLRMTGGFSNEEPDSFILYGSNDGENYDELLNSGALTWTHNETKTWDLNNDTAYKFYKVEAVNTKENFITISELQLIDHSITREY